MRILLIGPGNNGKYGDRFYYSNARRILNGFVRNGHFVLHTSDRDLADYALKIRPLGEAYARRRLADMAASLQPDLILLVHADIINAEAVDRMRKRAPGCRVACIDFDPLANAMPAARFGRMMTFCDAGFATSGGEPLRRLASGKPVFFIPNLVDISIDDQKSYENEPTADIFFAASLEEGKYQWQRALALAALAPDLKYFYAGRRLPNSSSAGGLWGYEFIKQLGRSKIGLNLNRIESDYYASSRMAQYLGNGCLLATDQASRFDDIFSDQEMIFFMSVEDLAERCTRLLSAGETWRTMAERGRARAIEIMSNTVVCDFIASVMIEGREPKDWKFSGR